ncbi:MAG TPA: cytochrome c [Bradyrhizobium sp.]|nr:cytochrome c [Bradyrhizobium sp.]
MKRRILFAILLAIVIALMLKYGAASATPVVYDLPPETAAFAPGPNLDTVVNNCTGCHSADYISMQPRGPKFKEDFWRAEVNKMIKVYGAPIAEADIARIVDYLVSRF